MSSSVSVSASFNPHTLYFCSQDYALILSLSLFICNLPLCQSVLPSVRFSTPLKLCIHCWFNPLLYYHTQRGCIHSPQISNRVKKDGKVKLSLVPNLNKWSYVSPVICNDPRGWKPYMQERRKLLLWYLMWILLGCSWHRKQAIIYLNSFKCTHWAKLAAVKCVVISLTEKLFKNMYSWSVAKTESWYYYPDWRPWLVIFTPHDFISSETYMFHIL